MERTMTFEEFVEKLRSVRDNYNFILGVVSNAITPEERRKIAYYIDHGKNVCVENIVLYSSMMSRARRDHENGIENSVFDKYIK